MVCIGTFIAGFGFLALSAALPTTIESNQLLTREWKDCAPGTSYYKCYNNDGCFASDPCITPPTQPTCKNGTTTKDQRSMHVVTPLDPETSTPDVGYFQVVSGDMDINEIGVFTGIPADAKYCSLNWKQGNVDERVFKVTGNGRVSAIQLDGLDTQDGITWSDVQKAQTVGDEAGPDLSFWDDAQYPAWDHGSWEFECRETMYVKFETFKGQGSGDAKEYRNVYLEQDEKNGFYISYTC